VDIKRSWLVQLVSEEVQLALREFSHGDGEPKKKKGKRPETKDAGEEPSKKSKAEKPKSPKSAPPPGDAAAEVDEPVEDPVAMGDGEYDTDAEDELSGDEELPGDADVAADNADASSDEDDALDGDGDAGTDIDGEVAEQIMGRVVENLTLEPESDLMAGCREIVLTFSDSPDILRMLVDKVGNIVFFLNGQPYDRP
jgi:hypothetical protein